MAHEEFKPPQAKAEQKHEFHEEEYGSEQYGKDTALKERFRSGTRNVSERLREGLGQTREQSKRVMENIGCQIEERPLMSVLIAFGAGLLLGAMLSGSRAGSMLSGSRGPIQINEQLSQAETGGIPPTM